MKKKLLILFSLVMVLCIALCYTSICFAEDEPVEAAVDEQPVVENAPIVQEAQAEEQTSDNNAWEWVKETWAKCKHVLIGAVSGISLSAIVSAIFIVFIKRSTNKVADKIEQNTNTNKIAELATEKFLANLADVKISMELKPMLESQVRATCEEVAQYFKREQIKNDEKNLALIKIMKKFAEFFNASVAVTDEQRQAVKEAIAEAEELYTNYNTTTAVVEVVSQPKANKQEIKTKVKENY